jgi:hypothetical protein
MGAHRNQMVVRLRNHCHRQFIIILFPSPAPLPQL